jgi:hypothetical protein
LSDGSILKSVFLYLGWAVLSNDDYEAFTVVRSPFTDGTELKAER